MSDSDDDLKKQSSDEAIQYRTATIPVNPDDSG